MSHLHMDRKPANQPINRTFKTADPSNVQTSRHRHLKKQNKNELLGRFETQIDEELSLLFLQLNTGLEGAEIKNRNIVDDLLSSFTNHLKHLEEAEKCIVIQLPAEEYSFKDDEGQVDKVGVVLGDQMSDFNNTFTSISEHINQVWEELEVVQRDIVCLSVEVFGKEILAVGQEIADETMKLIDAAQVIHEREELLFDTTNTELSNLRQKIEDLGRKSILESQRQLEEIKLGRQRQIKAVKEALKNFKNC